MALLILLVVSLLVGVVFTFGPAAVEMFLHWGAGVEAVSFEVVIITVIMTGVLILLWGINSMVRKEDGWLYTNIIPDGKADVFAEKAKKTINFVIICLVIIYCGLVAVMLLSNAMGVGESLVSNWREENAMLLNKLAWWGNMCLAAGVAFLISISTICCTPAFRRAMKLKGKYVTRGTGTPKE